METVFEDKVVLVTGATSGIGRAAAQVLAQRGARIVVVGRNEDRGREVVAEVEHLGGAALFVQADVTRPSNVEAMVRQTLDVYGRLDAVINNAASIAGAFKELADFDESDFDQAVSVGLKSVWLCMRAEIPAMLNQRPAGGAIVNVSSISGLGGTPHAALYSAAKAGVLALTKSAALEYGARGIRVNALVPGPTDTAMFDQLLAEQAGADNVDTARAALASKTALGRIASPKEIARAAVWLCSASASFVAGASLIVDGGTTCVAR